MPKESSLTAGVHGKVQILCASGGKALNGVSSWDENVPKCLPVSHRVTAVALLITRLFISTMSPSRGSSMISSKKHSGRCGLDTKVSCTWRLMTKRHQDLSHDAPCATSVASLLMGQQLAFANELVQQRLQFLDHAVSA